MYFFYVVICYQHSICFNNVSQTMIYTCICVQPYMYMYANICNVTIDSDIAIIVLFSYLNKPLRYRYRVCNYKYKSTLILINYAQEIPLKCTSRD